MPLDIDMVLVEFDKRILMWSRGSAFINPMEVVTEEEKQLFQKGEENKVR